MNKNRHNQHKLHTIADVPRTHAHTKKGRGNIGRLQKCARTLSLCSLCVCASDNGSRRWRFEKEKCTLQIHINTHRVPLSLCVCVSVHFVSSTKLRCSSQTKCDKSMHIVNANGFFLLAPPFSFLVAFNFDITVLANQRQITMNAVNVVVSSKSSRDRAKPARGEKERERTVFSILFTYLNFYFSAKTMQRQDTTRRICFLPSACTFQSSSATAPGFMVFIITVECAHNLSST